MVVLNYTGGEVNAKIVYYGPGLSGKTTNLEFIHDRTPENARGKMVSMKTQTDRTLFFDFLPLELGEISGYRTRFLLYTVPGQVYYNATRKLVLKGADAVVFVADSSRGKLDENLESLRNLEQNLNEHGMSLDELPWVIQYNKRDAPDAMAPADLDARLNPLRVPSFEAVATQGKGVYETFHGIATLVYRVLKERLERELESESASGAAARPAPAPAARPAPATPPTTPSGEVEFDSAIDSMLREMDASGRAAPAAHPTRVEKTVNVAPPVAAPPVPRAQVATPPAAAPSEMAATRVPAQESSASVRPGVDVNARGHATESFDTELGRLPALDDAAEASESVREEGPNEFVTDPMRKPARKDPASSPAPKSKPVAREAATLVEAAPPVKLPDAAESTPAPVLIQVPVVLTRAQARPGASIRVVLDIQIDDE